jgi:hypothetical protein
MRLLGMLVQQEAEVGGGTFAGAGGGDRQEDGGRLERVRKERKRW